MRAHRSIRNLSSLILAATFAALLGCAQPQVQPEGTAERVLELGKQLESMRKYASQMEKIYAAQEAEILALRQEVARLENHPNN